MSKQEKPSKRSLLYFASTTMVFLSVFLIVSLNVGWAGETTRILLVPFGVNAPKELSYVNRGINDMLTSRLEKDRKLIVITAGGDNDDADTHAQETSADYTITGSVTIMGESVSTDAQLWKGSDLGEPVLSFSRTGKQQADLIGHIDELAETINTRILGNQPKSIGLSTSAPAADVSVPETGVSLPDASQVTDALMSSPNAFNTTTIQSKSTEELTRIPGIRTIQGQVSGITAGDIDGDGIAEIVTITDDHLYIYCFKRGQWATLTEHNGLGAFIGVDAADVNRNGKEEIFVTRFSQAENKVYSFVLEWDGLCLKRIASQIPWYFRSVNIYNRGSVLAAQRQSHTSRFSSGIFEVQWKDGDYTMAESLPLPSDLNVFGFAQGAVRIQNEPEVVRYDSDGYIQILGPAGEEKWISTEHHGGGVNAVVFTDESQWDSQDLIYLPPRIRLYDLDNDGIQEVLVINNQKSFTGSSVLERHRFYIKGRLEWLKWKNEGIRTMGQTLDMARFIADFTLIDVDGDKKLDVVAAIVQKTKGMTTKGSSFLASVPIN